MPAGTLAARPVVFSVPLSRTQLDCCCRLLFRLQLHKLSIPEAKPEVSQSCSTRSSQYRQLVESFCQSLALPDELRGC